MEMGKVAKLEPGEQERFKLRRATTADIGQLGILCDAMCSLSLVSCHREDAVWRHELTRAGLGNHRNLYMIETLDGVIAGYTDLSGMGRLDIVRELAVNQDVSLRSVCHFLARWMKARFKVADVSSGGIYFKLGVDHPAYEALAPELGETVHPYAWYMRVPDLQAFLLKIRPVLEARLARSTMAGHSGTLQLNLYQSQLALHFESGRLVDVGDYQPVHFFDGDAFFPDHTFLHMLFGYRSLDEINHLRPDCFMGRDKHEAAVLLKILFPKQPSQIMPIA